MSIEVGELRRYLLGDLPDDASAAIEQEYFAREELLDRVWAAEYDLVDDYLAQRLTPDERSKFERHYLSTPDHRARVAAARELRASASAAAPGKPAAALKAAWWTGAAAAALVVLALAGAWLLRSRPVPPTSATSAPPSREQPSQAQSPGVRPPRASPVVAGISLSPITVRGSDDPATLTIAPEADLIRVLLEGEANTPPLGRGRAVVRTVSGTEAWRGPAADGSQPGAFAQVELHARTLGPDDYIVELFGTDASGRETERFRYFLRVRAR